MVIFCSSEDAVTAPLHHSEFISSIDLHLAFKYGIVDLRSRVVGPHHAYVANYFRPSATLSHTPIAYIICIMDPLHLATFPGN